MENKLKVKICNNRKEMGESAAGIVAERINKLLDEKGNINIIFAAAPSQNEFLTSLTKKKIQWSRINAFHMDEYIGLDAGAPQGFGNFLRDRIFDRVPLRSVSYLNGNAADIDEECARYGELIKEHAADIVCMGIGENGHIAFNDPPIADFNDPELVKAVALDPACRKQQVNDGCFSTLKEVPTHAVTLTVPALMNASYVFCIVPDKRKAEAVFNTLEKPQGPQFPSTILRSHSNAVLFLDKDSSSWIS